MSQPIHTPGPSFVQGHRGRLEIRESVSPDQDLIATLEGVRPGIAADIRANGRLLSAAYNAFDSAARKLGLNAVELAERMQAGGISDLVQALAAAHTSLRTFRNVPPEDQQWTSLDDDAITAVEWAIAKVEGDVT